MSRILALLSDDQKEDRGPIERAFHNSQQYQLTLVSPKLFKASHSHLLTQNVYTKSLEWFTWEVDARASESPQMFFGIARCKIIPDILERNEDGEKMSLCYYFLAVSAENDPCYHWCCGILRLPLRVALLPTTMMVIASHNNREKEITHCKKLQKSKSKCGTQHETCFPVKRVPNSKGTIAYVL